MIDINRSDFTFRYMVELGHSKVVVEGISRDDAIFKARKTLGSQMPRLYDVIRQAKSDAFRVQRIE